MYIVDEGDSKDVENKFWMKVDGAPAEYSDSWGGGSHDSTVVAVEKTTNGYVLAIKHETTTVSDYPDPTGDVTSNEIQRGRLRDNGLLEILNLSSDAGSAGVNIRFIPNRSWL